MSASSVSPAKLFDAAASGNVDLVKEQLDGGVDVDVDDPERGSTTALMLASARGHRDVAQLLLEQGADKNKPNATGKTALHWAAMRGHHNVIALLLEHQVEVEVVDQDGHTPLMRAVAERKWDVVTLLLDHGADPSRALGAAVTNRYPDLAKLLRDERVKANVPPEDLVRELERAVEVDDQSLVRALLEYGVPANTRGAFGLTPLHKATMRNCTPIGMMLVDHGAVLDATDDRARTALYHAALENQLEMGVFLLERGADPNICDTHGISPLHHAVRIANMILLRTLLEHGAAVDAPDDRGGTPLMYLQSIKLKRPVVFASKRNVGMDRRTRLLLEYGADRTLVDNRGHYFAQWSVQEVLDTYIPIQQQLQQLLLGLRGPTPSSLTRFASHPTFDPEVLPFIAAFLSGKGSNAFNEHQRADNSNSA